jgi:hypothetical protein
VISSAELFFTNRALFGSKFTHLFMSGEKASTVLCVEYSICPSLTLTPVNSTFLVGSLSLLVMIRDKKSNVGPQSSWPGATLVAKFFKYFSGSELKTKSSACVTMKFAETKLFKYRKFSEAGALLFNARTLIMNSPFTIK